MALLWLARNVIGLIIPFRPHFDTTLIQMDIPATPQYTQHMLSSNFENKDDNNLKNGIREMMSRNVGIVPDNSIKIGSFHQDLAAIPWYQWVGLLWVIGTLLFIAYHSIRHFHFLKMIKRWSQETANQKILDTLQSLQAELKISKKIKLNICPWITSPMLIGFINPVILLPSTDYPTNELAFILKHEMVHFKRKDLWYKVLVFLATTIHWFNPVVYLMARAIAVQCEIACDEEVVRGIDMDGRQKYIEVIIGVIKNQSQMQTAFSTNFYGGRRSMKNRIVSIMDTTKKKAGVFILCIVLIGTMGTGAVFAANTNTTSDLKPLTEFGGAIKTYYNPFSTLEDNVLMTLGKEIPSSKMNLKVISAPDYIDINGRKIDYYNRTEPYYSVKWNWKAKDSDIEKLEHKIMNIQGKNVTFAFSDRAAGYKDDKRIEKMLVNQITYELGYKDKKYDYDHRAFITELIDRGVYVIEEIITADKFGWINMTNRSSDYGFLGSKLLTKYDKKDKIKSVFNGKLQVPENIDGDIANFEIFTYKTGQ